MIVIPDEITKDINKFLKLISDDLSTQKGSYTQIVDKVVNDRLG